MESLHVFPACLSEKDMKGGKDCGWWLFIRRVCFWKN